MTEIEKVEFKDLNDLKQRYEGKILDLTKKNENLKKEKEN